jgi:hypothetical protein
VCRGGVKKKFNPKKATGAATSPLRKPPSHVAAATASMYTLAGVAVPRWGMSRLTPVARTGMKTPAAQAIAGEQPPARLALIVCLAAAAAPRRAS